MKLIRFLPFSLLLLSSCEKVEDRHCRPPEGVFTQFIGFDSSEVRAVYSYRFEKGAGMQQVLDSTVFYPVYYGDPDNSKTVNSRKYGDTLVTGSILLGSDWRVVVQPANVSWDVTDVDWADAVYQYRASSSSAVPNCSVKSYKVNGKTVNHNVIFLSR